jgi:hypothetical protein
MCKRDLRLTINAQVTDVIDRNNIRVSTGNDPDYSTWNVKSRTLDWNTNVMSF